MVDRPDCWHSKNVNVMKDGKKIKKEEFSMDKASIKQWIKEQRPRKPSTSFTVVVDFCLGESWLMVGMAVVVDALCMTIVIGHDENMKKVGVWNENGITGGGKKDPQRISSVPKPKGTLPTSPKKPTTRCSWIPCVPTFSLAAYTPAPHAAKNLCRFTQHM